MLSQLTVSNFAIADKLDILFEKGMTVLSGETGAGKSIILDALGLTLGDRADTSMVRHGESKAEISATFDLDSLPQAHQWLEEHDLDAGNQCILRRVITAEGRSRSYINGHPSPLQNLKTVGELLIDIHSQHEHQSLLNKDNHREILDNFGQLSALTESVKAHFNAWHKKEKQLTELENNQDEILARIQLLKFQVDELENLNLQEGEIEELEAEQRELSNAELLLSRAHQALALSCDDETNANSMISQASSYLSNLPTENSDLSDAQNLLSDAQIQIEEAASSLRHFIDSFELNPERLTFIEERLSSAYQLARKHRCEPDELSALYQTLSDELNQYSNGTQNLDQLSDEVTQLREVFLGEAQTLREARIKAAKTLEANICEQLALMDMKSVTFSVSFTPLEKRKFNQHGLDAIEFLISTNPGQPAKPISKVASGGELSRISLAIQVIVAKTSTIPTLVFDEVDVGIGGGTAQIVGRLLKKLGEKGQIICVTHLPQVASQGDQHYFISKTEVDGKTCSSIRPLTTEERTREVARMLGGVELTEHTIAHAKEMLETA